MAMFLFFFLNVLASMSIRDFIYLVYISMPNEQLVGKWNLTFSHEMWEVVKFHSLPFGTSSDEVSKKTSRSVQQLMIHEVLIDPPVVETEERSNVCLFLVNQVSYQHSPQNPLGIFVFMNRTLVLRTHRSSKREVLPADFLPSFFVRKVLDFLSYLGGKDPLGRG